MSPEEESSHNEGCLSAAAITLHQVGFSLEEMAVSDSESPEVCKIISSPTAVDVTSNSSVPASSFQQSGNLSPVQANEADVEKFDGKIVYNPDGSAYIIEGESELSEDDSLPDGCIVDSKGTTIPHSLVLPQIANAYYVSKIYAHHLYQSQHRQQQKIFPSNQELPVMHSYRVICYRNSDGSKRTKDPPIIRPSTPSTVPVKPILMCFICKLSFAYAKSFVSHAQSDHQLLLVEDEKRILSDSTASAIIQVVGKEKKALISILEPTATSSFSNNYLEVGPTSQFNSKEKLQEGMLTSDAAFSKTFDKNNLSKSAHLQQTIPTNLHKDSKQSNNGQSKELSIFQASKGGNLNAIASQNIFCRNSLLSSNTSNNANSFISTTIGVCSDPIKSRLTDKECSKCDVSTSNTRISVTTPIGGIHSRNSCKTLKCPKCNWHYKYQETLEIHMKEKHPDNETSCLYCIAGQPHPRLARGETYTCGYKPYRCEVCNYSTTTKGNLSIHMQSDKHLNNMQELQGNNVSNMVTATTPQDISIQNRSPNLRQNHSPSSANQPGNHTKSKPTFRCDVCNYETNVARNLRIHMTSEKHTHNMIVLQQNVKHIQSLSALQLHQPATAIQTKNSENILNMNSLEKPQHTEAALADIAYNQALLIQMITGNQYSPQFHAVPPLSSEYFSNSLNLNSYGNVNMEVGWSPDGSEFPVEPADLDPVYLYHCCICNNFSSNSVEGLSIHLASDRTKICETDILSNVGGQFVCKLCSYKTNLKANFQLHCKTDKHLQKLQIFNHVKEGGVQNEWKLKYLTTSSSSTQIRCHACDFITNSIQKLILHISSPRHEAAALLLHHLVEASRNIESKCKLYQCCLCGFTAKNRLSLLQHVRSIRHLQMEQLNQVHRKNSAKGEEVPLIDIGEVFKVAEISQTSSFLNITDNGSDPNVSENTAVDEKIDDLVTNNEVKEEIPDKILDLLPNETHNVCPQCNFSVSSIDELKEHMQNNHIAHLSENNESNHKEVNKNLICPLCQDSFILRSDLEIHVMRIHSVNSDGLQRLLVLVDQSHWLNSNNQGIDDSLCQSRASTPFFMKTNIDEVPDQSGSDDSEENIKCSICGVQCNSFEAVQQHHKEIHPTLTPTIAVSEKHVYKFRCGQCSLAFKTINRLQDHLQYHIIRDATKCAICNRTFRSLQALQRHIEGAHNELQYSDLSSAKQNFLTRNSSLEIYNDDSTFTPKTLEEEQIETAEEKSEEDENELTEDAFMHKEQVLIEDYLNSQSIAEDLYSDQNRKYKCHRCKVAYTQQIYLTEHNKTLSHRKGDKATYPIEKYLDPNRPYKCDICKESFTQKNILLVHYNSVSHLHKLKRAVKQQTNTTNKHHLSVKNISECENNQDQGRKPYKCNICKVSYSQGSTLDIHMRSVLHQSRAAKIHDLAVTGQIDLSKPLIEQPQVIQTSIALNTASNCPSISCLKCNEEFTSIDQLLNHQKVLCPMNNALSEQVNGSKTPRITSTNSPPPTVSSTDLAENMQQCQSQLVRQDICYFKQKTSQMYKHLLEGFGFDLVMQFNESHQKRQDTDEDINISLEDKICKLKEKERNIEKSDTPESEIFDYGEHKVVPELVKSVCQHCNKEFSSVWVLKAHSEEVHGDSVPREFLEKYAQHFKYEYEKKVVVVTAATSSSTSTAPVNTSQSGRPAITANKENEDNIENMHKISEATSTTPTTTPILSTTPVSSVESLNQAPSNPAPSFENQSNQFNLMQHMSELQAAINVMAASQLHQQFQQYPSIMMNMMSLPLSLNIPALAAMNIQPPLVPIMLSTQGFDSKQNSYSQIQPDVFSKQQFVLQQQQQNTSSQTNISQKRARTRITDDQLKILRANFDINNSPGEDQIIDMATQSGLPTKVIKHWFRNTLFKERQRNKDSPYNFNNPPSTTLNIEEYEKSAESAVSPNGSNASEIVLAHKDEVKEFFSISSGKIPCGMRHEQVLGTSLEGAPRASPIESSEDNSLPSSPFLNSSLCNDQRDNSNKTSQQHKSSCSPMLPPKPCPQNVFEYLPSTSVSHSVSSNTASLRHSSSPSKLNADFCFIANQSSSNLSTTSSGKRANRTRFTDYQIKVLQEFFENNAYPKDDDLEYLSKLLSLSPRVIVVWFQNARQKARKVYENQPISEPLSSTQREVEEIPGRFQRTPALNYQCKKCLHVFQRYYELIRHQKTHCFKEEDAKRSAQAQAAAAQAAAVFSSEDSNSSSNTTPNVSQICPMPHNANDSSANSPIMLNVPLSQNFSDGETKEGSFQCDKCNLVLTRFELWREHQLVHIMNPSLFQCNYTSDSSFDLCQNQILDDNDSLGKTPQTPNLSREKKKKLEDFDDSISADSKSFSDHNEQPKDKRLRTTILPEQLDYLYQKYQIESNPSRKMLETIAKEVGLKKRVVQVWFQNTRARERKGQFRAHSQAINKRCPFCPALFKVKSALESHLSNKHSDQVLKGEVNIDNIPDEEISMESSPSITSASNIFSSSLSKNSELEHSIKKYYEESMRRYMNELQVHTNNGQQEMTNPSVPCSGDEFPLDLSRHVHLGSKININNVNNSLDEQNNCQESRSVSEYVQLTEFSEKSIYDDDSASETTEFLEDESNPNSPASSTQSSKQGVSSSSLGNTITQPICGGAIIQSGGKRYRTQMTTTQVKVMKSLFSDYKTPTMAECEMLGREIGLPKRVVQVWFQNARAKEKKARLAAGLPLDDSATYAGLSGPEDCKLCNLTYTTKISLQEHIFSQKHVENVRIAVENGSLIPPTPGAPILRDSVCESSTNDCEANQSQTEENVMYGSLFLHPTAMFSHNSQQNTMSISASSPNITSSECLAEILDS